MINYQEMERRWQNAWADAKVFEPEPNEKEGFLVTFAFPYVNSPMHAGHMKTYSLTDSFARYLRMKGYNVLLPAGFHMTGTPILSMAKRISRNDAELIKDFREIYQVPEDSIRKMSDPLYLASYFAQDTEAGLKEGGLGIDWRRKFNSIDPHFSKFVEWQFLRMKEKGLLTQGTHPVGWCTNEGNAVGSHDTKGDAQPKIEEMLAIKFKDTSSNAYFPCATYRPETVYGVTNIFIKEDSTYVIAEIDGTQYYMSREASFALSHQFDIQLKGEMPARELLKKKAINPMTKEEVPVLPGFFIKPDVGTGVVMSVPAHAPFDYAALERLKVSGYQMPHMQYKKVIDVEQGAGAIGKSLDPALLNGRRGSVAHPDIPALAYLELMNADSNAVYDILEMATKAIYKEEAHFGVMTTGNYTGKPEAEARELIANDLIKSNDALKIFIIANDQPIICRCGTRVIVKIVSDQWFINYGDKNWKEQVRKALPSIGIYPGKLRPTFGYLVDWLDLRAAERAQGLGTPFPFNPTHIIESLSDSTIYMIFYTFVHILNANNITPEQLKPEFFDYVISSKGNIDSVAASTGMDNSIIKNCKDSFDYWYTNTSNHSGSDLINNHFIMYIFTHVIMLEEKYWPKKVVSCGLLLYEGQKMSKSIGNTIPVRILIAKHGSDPVRFSSIATADLESETNFEEDTINSVKQKNEFLLSTVDMLNRMNGVELEHIDYWLYSKLNRKIENATKQMDIVELRNAVTEIYYNSVSELKWYVERGGHNQVVAREFLENIALMLAPIMPHFAEEFWKTLGNTTLAVQQLWPKPNAEMVDENVELIEDIISNTSEDINNTMMLTSRIPANKGKKVKEIKIILAEEWKRAAFNSLVEKREMGRVIKEPGLESMDKEKLTKYLNQFMKKLATLRKIPEIKAEELYASFIGSRDYLKKKLGTEVTVERESASKSARADRALPDKPSIDIIWA